MIVEKKKLGFKAIAVAACTDMDGRVVALRTVDKSIDKFDFVKFLDDVRDYTRHRWCTLFVDNLGVHYTDLVKARAKTNRIHLLYNGTYSSEFNPIERLWAWSKREFAREAL